MHLLVAYNYFMITPVADRAYDERYQTRRVQPFDRPPKQPAPAGALFHRETLVPAAVVQPLRDDHQELLSYVAQLSGELAMMSRAARLDALGYFLEMAKIEALGALSRLETAD